MGPPPKKLAKTIFVDTSSTAHEYCHPHGEILNRTWYTVSSFE